MRSPRRITLLYLLGLGGSVLAFALVYWRGMAAFEGEEYSLLHSLRIVVETYTTTGYGSDAPWESTEMNLVVLVMNTVGTVTIFLALPVFLTPLLRNALERTPPTSLEDRPEDHVVLAAHSPRTEPLTEVLEDHGVDYVVVEPDEETALDLREDGETVLHGDPADRPALEAARLRDARALVVDVDDRRDASIVLTAREIDEDVRIVSVLDEPDRAAYHRLAGADDVVATRPVLGRRLAEMATAAVRTDLGQAIELGDAHYLVELPVSRAGELEGETLGQSGLPDEDGVEVVGLWRDGEFTHPVTEDVALSAGTVLLVVGREPALTELARRALGRPREPASGETIVVGHGEVGAAVTRTLAEWELPYTVVDREPGPGVDVVGDASEPSVLSEAGVEAADALVLAVPDDAETEFATLVARDANEGLHVAARADDDGSVRRLFRAGADYVLPVNDVTGRILGATVLELDPVLAADAHVRVTTVAEGSRVADESAAAIADLLPEGCRIVALERDGEVVTGLEGDEQSLRAGDRLALVGPDEELEQFVEECS